MADRYRFLVVSALVAFICCRETMSQLTEVESDDQYEAGPTPPPRPSPGALDYQDLFMKLENRLQELNLLDIPSKDAAGASGLDIEEDDHEETTSSKEKDPDADAESPHLKEEKEEVEKRKNGGSSDIPVGDVDENPRKGKGGISEDESPEKRQPGRILGEGFKLGKRGSEDEVRKQLENIMVKVLQHFVRSVPEDQGTNEKGFSNAALETPEHSLREMDKRAFGRVLSKGYKLGKRTEDPYSRRDELENMLRRLNGQVLSGVDTNFDEKLRQSMESLLEAVRGLETMAYRQTRTDLPVSRTIEELVDHTRRFFRYGYQTDAPEDGCHEGPGCSIGDQTRLQIVSQFGRSTDEPQAEPNLDYSPMQRAPDVVQELQNIYHFSTAVSYLKGSLKGFVPDRASDVIPTGNNRRNPKLSENPAEKPYDRLFAEISPGDADETPLPYYKREARGLGKVLGNGFKLGKRRPRREEYRQPLPLWLPAGYRLFVKTAQPQSNTDNGTKRSFWVFASERQPEGQTKAFVTSLSSFYQNMEHYVRDLQAAIQTRPSPHARGKRAAASWNQSSPPGPADTERDGTDALEAHSGVEKRFFWRRLGRILGYRWNTKPTARVNGRVDRMKRSLSDSEDEQARGRQKRAFWRLLGGYKFGKRSTSNYDKVVSEIEAAVGSQDSPSELGVQDDGDDESFEKRGFIGVLGGYKLGKREQSMAAELENNLEENESQVSFKRAFGRLLGGYKIGKRDQSFANSPYNFPGDAADDVENSHEGDATKRAFGRLLGGYMLGKRELMLSTSPDDYQQDSDDERQDAFEGVTKRAFGRLFGGSTLGKRQDSGNGPDDNVHQYDSDNNDQNEYLFPTTKRAFGRLLGGYLLGKREQSSATDYENYPSDAGELTGDADATKRAFGRILGGYKLGKREQSLTASSVTYIPEAQEVDDYDGVNKRAFGRLLGGYLLGKRDQTMASSYSNHGPGAGQGTESDDVTKRVFGRRLGGYLLGKRDKQSVANSYSNHGPGAGEDTESDGVSKRAFGRLMGGYLLGKRDQQHSMANSYSNHGLETGQDNESDSVIKRAFGRLMGGYLLGKRDQQHSYSNHGQGAGEDNEFDVTKRAFGRLNGGYLLGKRDQRGMTSRYGNPRPEADEDNESDDVTKRAFGRLLGGYKIGKRDGMVPPSDYESDDDKEKEVLEEIKRVFSGMIARYIEMTKEGHTLSTSSISTSTSPAAESGLKDPYMPDDAGKGNVDVILQSPSKRMFWWFSVNGDKWMRAW